MSAFRRYLRAFALALKLTLRGQTLPPSRHSDLWAWVRAGAAYVDAIYRSAEANQVDKIARQTLKIHLDGRDMSLEVVLATLRHHFGEEYPYLLQHTTAHNITAIHASNLNGRYWLQQLQTSEELPTEVRAALAALGEHLDNIPSGEDQSTLQVPFH